MHIRHSRFVHVAWCKLPLFEGNWVSSSHHLEATCVECFEAYMLFWMKMDEDDDL